MGKIAILDMERTSKGLSAADCATDLATRIASGDIHSDAKMMVIILNPKGPDFYEGDGWDEPYDILQLAYGLNSSELITLFECAKIQVLRGMGYIPEHGE